MLHLAEETTKVFDFLSCLKFCTSSFSVCIKMDFEVSDMNEILSFPRKFLYQNVDYVKFTYIQIHTNVQVRQI